MPVAFRNGAVCNITQYKNPPPKKEKRKEVRNMKHVKKLFAMLMAVMMLVGLLSVTSFAADGKYTITAPDNNRTYAVYQIMTGDLSKNDAGKEVLSNVKWGTNAAGKTGAVTADEMKAVIAINELTTEAAKAAALAAYVNLNSDPVATVSKGNPAEVVSGYYLIKDNGPVADKEAYSLYIVQVVGDTTIDPKVGTTSSQKKVDDKNDSNTSEDEVVWNDSADYDIGDQVPFQLKATICADYANYTYGYKLTFHDKECEGLTFNKNSVKVYVGENSTTPISNSFYEVVTEGLTDGCTFEVRFANLKAITDVVAGSVIRVEYTSELNAKANIGDKGNINTSHISYTNNPNDNQAGENGKTPDDTVIVFTYQVNVNKVDQNNKPLAGAKFTLSKKVGGEYKAIKELEAVAVKNDADEVVSYTASFVGIDDGDYKLSETVTPVGYNTAADIEFTVTASHNIVWEGVGTALTNLSAGDKVTGVVSTGVLSTDVVNNAGSTLPETGGMGTYIFYAVGGVLVLAAVVLFVTKKRMSNAD